jgi:hypothetical protein
MTTRRNEPIEADEAPLIRFELPAAFVKPAVGACRLFNGMLDVVFYDVPNLLRDLYRNDREVETQVKKLPSRIINLDALANPEGSLLLIDAATAPYVHQFHDVELFLNSPHPETRQVEIASITGVGSSALGSAALAWDVSVAFKKPVLAIVPGYGLADVVLQGLGGWFGFGLHDYLGTKSTVQNVLASVAPNTAKIGRDLSASVSDAKTLNGAPVFRHGSGSSDVLHALMKDRATPFKLVVGHSKGALAIGNALRSLEKEKTDGLHVVTLGCPIAKDAPGAIYHQYLGMFDLLGQMNMWGHWPSKWEATWHSTNPYLPLTMAAGELSRAP